jgi:Protein of unknown function (DUF541)
MPGAKAALMAFHIPMTERFGWSLRERPIIAFLVSDPSKTLDQAREAAIADARRKAEVYAQASSLQLRRVEWITEDAGFAPPGPMRAQGASVPMAVSVPIATGEETLRVRVTVGFDTLPEVRRGVLHACRSELGRKGCP